MQRTVAAFENEHAWNRRDVVFHGQFRVFVHVHFANLDAARVLIGDFVDDGSQRSAWPAPRRQKSTNTGWPEEIVESKLSFVSSITFLLAMISSFPIGSTGILPARYSRTSVGWMQSLGLTVLGLES